MKRLIRLHRSGHLWRPPGLDKASRGHPRPSIGGRSREALCATEKSRRLLSQADLADPAESVGFFLSPDRAPGEFRGYRGLSGSRGGLRSHAQDLDGAFRGLLRPWRIRWSRGAWDAIGELRFPWWAAGALPQKEPKRWGTSSRGAEECWTRLPSTPPPGET